MLKVGDKVKIKKDKVLEKYKKYNGIYTITQIRKFNDNLVGYKIKGIPDWALEEHLEKVDDK